MMHKHTRTGNQRTNVTHSAIMGIVPGSLTACTGEQAVGATVRASSVNTLYTPKMIRWTSVIASSPATRAIGPTYAAVCKVSKMYVTKFLALKNPWCKLLPCFLLANMTTTNVIAKISTRTAQKIAMVKPRTSVPLFASCEVVVWLG